MRKRIKNDYAIFFRLPTVVVEHIETIAFDLHMTRTQFIRMAISHALERCKSTQPICRSY